MSRLITGTSKLPLTMAIAMVTAVFAMSASPAHAQFDYYESDDVYEDGIFEDNNNYYGDGNYGDDWYYDYYDGEEYEYESGEGLHQEEWYDPSDWFDNDQGVDYERDDWGFDNYDGQEERQNDWGSEYEYEYDYDGVF